MKNISLFIDGDIVFVVLLTIIYLTYSYIKKINTDIYIKFSLIFFTCYILCFYLIHFGITASEVKGLFLSCFLPVLALSHIIFPFKKNRIFNRYLIITTGIYLILFLVIIIGHYFSNM